MNSTRLAPREFKIKQIVVGIFVGIVVLLFFGVLRFIWSVRYAENDPVSETFEAEYYQPAPTPGSDLDTIEADAEIKIPSSAKEIYAKISGFRELDTWVRFELPANEIDLFLDGTLCTSPMVSVNPTRYTRNELIDPDWWQPDQAKDLLACDGGHQYLYQRILVDCSDKEIFTVYVLSITNDFGTPIPNSP